MTAKDSKAKETRYTVDELADLLKVSKRTILREIKRGNLNAQKAGRRYLFTQKELDNYLKQEQIEPEKVAKSFFKDRKPEMVNLLQKLVSMSSVSYEISQQNEITEYLVSILEGYGIRCRLIKEEDAIAVHGSFGYADKGLLLNCPLTTPPLGDLSKWKHPPFGGVIKAGKMYGRGAADAKGGIVAMIFAVLALKEFADEDDLRVELVFDGGEQDGTYKGMNSVLNSGLYVDSGIIGYTNEDLNFPIGARGQHRYKFTTRGGSAPVGVDSKMGENAIETMISFISKMKEVSKNSQNDSGYIIDSTQIHGGESSDIVPDKCALTVTISTSPSFTKAKIDDLIQKIISEILIKEVEVEIEVEYIAGNEAYILDEDEQIVETTSSVMDRILGSPPSINTSVTGSVGNMLYERGVPMVFFGPVGGNVHSYDEWVEIDSLPTAAEVYFNTVLKYFEKN